MGAVICIGRPTIERAAKGLEVEVGQGVTIIAADDLFHADPYTEIERLRKIEAAARDLMDNSPIGDDDKPYCSDVAGREFDALYLSLNAADK